MKLEDKNSIFKNDKLEKEVLNNQRKTNIKILNYRFKKFRFSIKINLVINYWEN